MAEPNSNRRWLKPIILLFKLIKILFKLSMILAGVYVLISLSLPILLTVYPGIMKHIVFLNFLKTGSDFTQPEKYGLDRVFNFYLDVEPGVRLGVWHYRSPLVKDQIYTNEEDYFRKHIQSTPPSIPMLIYFHGNAWDRAFFNRVGTCKKLRDELKYDVFVLDYRGFGDSTGEPTEKGLIQDARYVYDWLHNITEGQRKIYIWGQSLGSAVACQLAARLSDDGSKSLGGLVLEAAFINIHEAIKTHYISSIFRWQPWFSSMIEQALQENQLAFLTRGHLSHVNCACVLLHADDDLTIPYRHGRQLLQAALAARSDHKEKRQLPRFTIDMISFHGEGYGHSRIYKSTKVIPALKRIIFEEHL